MTGRAFVLGCVVVTMACGGAAGVETGADELTSTGPIAVGIERQRIGDGAGSVADVQQRSVHFGNAHALALISQEAYAAATTPASLAAAGVPGFTSVTAFDNSCTGGYGFFADGPTVAVLTFRGTQPDTPIDVEIDADDALHDYPFTRDGASAKIHNGFRRQFESLWSADPSCGVPQGIRAVLAARTSQAPVYFTGHSLGGALSVLALAQTFVEGTNGAPSMPVAGVYTFGAPKNGNDVFAEVLGDAARRTKTPIYRFVHKNDLVVTQPRSFGSVLHETWQHVQPAGEPEHAFQVWFDEDSAKIGVFALFLGFSIGDHSLDGYIADIATNARARGELP